MAPKVDYKIYVDFFLHLLAVVDDSAYSHEASPLLGRREEDTTRALRPEIRVMQTKFTPQLMWPVALPAALAIASTESTSFYAYPMLLSHDPAHCKEDEQTLDTQVLWPLP
jgi:hypothetical protein